jgi:peptidoglycan/LPS O-acetylase OafA/YrhL
VPFRPDIEGLRALAVLAVMVWHAGLPGLSGGYAGVDVFFVVSGFLMTSLLVADHDRRGRARVLSFWARRVARILPAMTVLLGVVAVATAWVLPRLRWSDVAADLLDAGLFRLNSTLADRATDYMRHAEAPSPLLHLWSLAVEMQFYAVWPLLFVALTALAALILRKATTRGQRAVPGAVVAGACAIAVLVPSLLWSIWRTPLTPERAYFATSTRLWELALGGLVAALPVARLPRRLARMSAAAGLVLILVSFVVLDRTTAFPGAAALLPCGGAALVLAGRPAVTEVVGRTLGLSPLQWIGRHSYSLYLWHWPLLVALAAQLPQQAGRLEPWQAVPVLALSFLPAWLSRRWVEEPVRRLARAPHQRRALLVVVAAAIVSVLGSAGIQWAAARPAPAVAWQPGAALARAELPDSYARRCHVPYAGTAPRECDFGSATARRTVVLVGDSHAAQWLPAQAVAQQHQWRLVTMTKSSCPYLDLPVGYGWDGRPFTACATWNHAVAARLTALSPDLVVTSAADLVQPRQAGPPSPHWLDEAKQAYRRTWGTLTAQGSRVVVLHDTPRPGFDVADCLSRWGSDPAHCDAQRPAALANRTDLVGAAAGDEGVSSVDLTDDICLPTRCPAVRDGLAVFRDDHHLTVRWSRHLAGALDAALAPAMDAAGNRR